MSVAKQIEPLFSKRRKRFFAGSRYKDLAAKTWTEWELVETAAKKLGMTLDEYVHRAILITARRDVATAKVREKLPVGEHRSGVPGIADKRIAAAYEAAQKSGQPITVGMLKRLSRTNYVVVREWVERNAGKLEVPIVSMPAAQNGPRNRI